MAVEELRNDCDGDAIVVRVRPRGPACHTGSLVLRACPSGARSPSAPQSRPEGSYTTKLLDEGVPGVARKVGEEAVEVMVAAFAESDERILSETADLIYHLYVLLAARGLDLAAVEDELATRAR